MSTIRPEVLAFAKAAQELLCSETDGLPLSDEEMEELVHCVAKVEQALQESDI